MNIEEEMYSVAPRGDKRSIKEIQDEEEERETCPICSACMNMERGFRCSGYVCPNCGHNEMDNDYY